jgi:hypothetical protein
MWNVRPSGMEDWLREIWFVCGLGQLDVGSVLRLLHTYLDGLVEQRLCVDTDSSRVRTPRHADIVMRQLTRVRRDTDRLPNIQRLVCALHRGREGHVQRFLLPEKGGGRVAVIEAEDIGLEG